MSDPALWQRYTWRGQEVVVIQRWTDPFGRAMLRVADPNDEDRAEGLPLDQFLADATPTNPADTPDA